MREGGTGWAPMCMSRHWESASPSSETSPRSMAARMSWHQGTSSQTIVQRSAETVSRMVLGEVPFRMTARLPVKSEPNQCIFAPV